MTTPTVATLKRISAPSLRDLLLSARVSSVAIIDVRDDDFVGGHIRDCIHVPTPALDHKIPELIRTLGHKETVVFHCSLSQQRGPTAALRYLRERETKLGKGEVDTRKGDGEGRQEVYVLDKGFVGWQKLYGRDEKLTEGYAPDIWEDEE